MSRWWNEVVLYFIPVLLGGGAAMLLSVEEYPFPTGLKTLGGRMMYGVFIGFFASFIFKGLKATIQQLSGVKADHSDLPSD